MDFQEKTVVRFLTDPIKPGPGKVISIDTEIRVPIKRHSSCIRAEIIVATKIHDHPDRDHGKREGIDRIYISINFPFLTCSLKDYTFLKNNTINLFTFSKNIYIYIFYKQIKIKKTQ